MLQLPLSQIHLRPIVQLQGGILKPPPRDVDKLECVVLPKDFLITKDLDLLVFFEVVEELLRYELLEVRDCGLGGAPDELTSHLFQLHAVRFQQDVDLLVRPVTICLVFFGG